MALLASASRVKNPVRASTAGVSTLAMLPGRAVRRSGRRGSDAVDGCWLGMRNRTAAVARPMQPGDDERDLEAAVGGKRQQDRRRDGAAEEAREGVHRERPADAVLGDAVGQDGVVGGVIDAVGEAGHDRRHEQPRIGADEARARRRPARRGRARRSAPGAAPMRSTRKPIGACVRPVTTLKVVSASPRSRKPTFSRSLSSGSSTGSTMM